MTELEGQFAVALKRLSAQFRTEQRQDANEQRRQSEQFEALLRQVEQQAAENEVLRQRVEQQAAESATLRRQVERLDGQVTGLARDYETLAATLRELWR